MKLDFSNVLIRPQKTTLCSRKQVNLLTNYNFKHSNKKWEGIPIIATNMDTISTIDMYNSLSKHNLITCFHKYIDVSKLVYYKCDPNLFMLSTGISKDDYDSLVRDINYLKINGIEVKQVCVDVANGYMQALVDFCKKLREDYPEMIIAAGSVVTEEMVEELITEAKVDIVRVGIGSGSVCTTRLQTGVGMPQLSAVLECAKAAKKLGARVISDGGICCPGDIGKAFGAGADYVMIGSMFSGHDECAGEIIVEDGKKYKTYYGMSSDTAMNKYHNGVAKYRSSEGKTVKVPYKGKVENTILDMLGGLRSTCTYVDAHNLYELRSKVTFMEVYNVVNNFYK